MTTSVFSVDEVLNLTVEDLHGLDVIDVGWPTLPPETREKCIQKLRGPVIRRELMRQRKEAIRSNAVDPNKLEEKLQQISSNPTPRSSSPDSSISTTPSDYEEVRQRHHEEVLRRDLRIEGDSYIALIAEGGIPSHPVELGFDVLENPGEYKDIVSYWKSQSGSSRLLFLTQIREWRKFRGYQQRVRQYYIHHNRFPEYQQKVSERRRRHGLEGDVILLEDRDQQSKPGHVTMEDWMEYQAAKILALERLEKKVEDRHTEVESAEKVLAEAGIPEGVYVLGTERSDEDWKEYDERMSAKHDLELAQRRLEAAQSDHFGETVERAAWIRLFQKEVQPAQARFQEASKAWVKALKVQEEARMAWLKALEKERKASGETDMWPGEVVSLESLEAQRAWLDARDEEDIQARKEGKEERKMREEERMDEEQRREREESEKLHSARKEMEFAEEGLKAAQWDDFGETVGRAALVRLIREEIESAQTRLDEAKASGERVTLKHNLLYARKERGHVMWKLERHRILVEWIERQRQAMASERTAAAHDAENHDDQGLTKRPQQRALRNHSAQALRPNRSSEGYNLKRTRAQTRSVLSTIDPARVSKARGKEKTSRPKMSISSGASQSAQAASIDPSVSHSRSKEIFKAKDAMLTPLRPIHSSKVFKSKDKRLTGLQSSDMKVLRTADQLQKRQLGSRCSIGQKSRLKSADVPTRSSTRISKKSKEV